MRTRLMFWLHAVLLALLVAPNLTHAEVNTFPELWWPQPAADGLSIPTERFVLAVVGDYGFCAYQCGNEQAVADLVHSWHPQVIITTGDNSNYNGLAWEVQADQKPYADDIKTGSFFPTQGNHDWGNQCANMAGIQPSLQHFGVPLNYMAHFGQGLIDLIAVDTTCARTNLQTGAEPHLAEEYRATLAASTALWRITVGHHPLYSSGQWGVNADRHWLLHPTVDVYLSGHDHDFEHLMVGGQHFVVNGVGGQNVYPLGNSPIAGSLWGYWKDFGAVKITVTYDTLTVEFINVQNEVLHAFTLGREKSLGTYAMQVLSQSPPWYQAPLATKGLEVILRRAGANYVGKLGNSGRTIAIPPSVVQQADGLFILSAFLKSSVALRRSPDELLSVIPAELNGLSAADRQVIAELYATLLDMQQNGQFGSIWAGQLAKAQVAGV